MPLHRTGRNIIALLLSGSTAPTALASTGAVLWVGSGTAAHDSLDNHLKAASIAATMESGYPTQSVNVNSYRGLYATNVANFNWQEWGVKNATTTATSTAGNTYMLQRMQEDLGTKANTQQWQLTVSLTFTT